MNLFSFFSKKHPNYILTNWDSRKEFRISILEETPSYKIQERISQLNSFSAYKNCFLNNCFLLEIAQYFDSPKLFEKCEIELNTLTPFLSLIESNEFHDCIFYLNDSVANDSALDSSTDLTLSPIKRRNKIIKSSYIEHLCKKYKNNLKKAPIKLVTGISINNADLSNTILPNKPDWFKSLGTKDIYNVKLPKLDFNNYNLGNIRFSNCTFDKNSIVSENLLSSDLYECILPKIDFNNLKRLSTNQNLRYRFNSCTFDNDTKFPEDINFFTDNVFTSCLLPDYDYSLYNVNKTTFMGCTFSEKSTLPIAMFKKENIDIINYLKNIPQKYLSQIVLSAPIRYPESFFFKHLDRLTHEDIFILHQKYQIPKQMNRLNNITF
ncbi:hypothetical protein ACV3V0_16520 [Clostridium perfringens]